MNFDHLSLRDETNNAYKKISKIVEKYEQTKYSRMVFSDYMFRYSFNFKKNRYIILITDNCLYVLSQDNYNVIGQYYLKDIKSILTITTNSSLFAINFVDRALMLESIRRTEVLIFLINNAELQNRPAPEINKSYKIKMITDGF